MLQSLATSLNSPAVPDTPEALSQTQSDFSPRFLELLEPLTEAVSNAAEEMCSQFLRSADDALFLAARDAGNNLDETRYLDGQSEIRGRTDHIEQRIPELLRKGISILSSPFTLREDDSDTSSLP